MDEEMLNDYDAPNTWPYKQCSKCGERNSCGLYDLDKVWFCEDCYVDEEEIDNLIEMLFN
jgi:hypothetical protein